MADETELGRDLHLVTAALDGTSHDPLAVEGPVDLGGVDVRDAELECAVDGANRLGVVQRSAGHVGACHGHGAEADAGDHEVAEVCVLHQTSSLDGAGGVSGVGLTVTTEPARVSVRESLPWGSPAVTPIVRRGLRTVGA